MRLEPGTCLGSLEIVAHAGAGGMGSVYRARGRFLMLRLAGNEASVPRTSFRIVLNWAAHLDQRAGSSEQ